VSWVVEVREGADGGVVDVVDFDGGGDGVDGRDGEGVGCVPLEDWVGVSGEGGLKRGENEKEHLGGDCSWVRGRKCGV
jgi:hypothetical protein